MWSIARVAGFGLLAAGLALAAPGVSIGAGMGGMGLAGGMGGPGMMGSGPSDMTMGSYTTPSSGAAAGDPADAHATDPSVRNLSHTGLRMKIRVSKAWQDLPMPDSRAGGTLAPVPAMPPAANTSN